ncbi:hypothetical protein N474_13155 [Pseudoalteromonas luteoviolacea CPMOR-2]|uniref:Glutaredoxin domain-containing protein n=1 Tax=Pseudoalteromonas luteoviolacea DSM 6061 TaxID=1365250 RepID=A0A161XTQ4_9GAMM|nr:glutaredoxin domain-containing protein [Pseudoalteromonas luteoviolacea]KZN30698.1 hypothetical protein N475_24545 [Pseudoalteromonas luteoviolacea DSM 6061]KZN56223.1 hypothetical protein N474_13155 [Pseudoalteromonas luteoviolacea CPMOR-2]MBE0388445.1 hypothetical protein [Pseudoalteromonas luteoviolacea DSM 6061]
MSIIKYLAIFALTLGVGWFAGTYGLTTVQNLYASNQVEKGDYSQYGVSTDNPIKLYTTEWCPYCKKAAAFLDQHHIQYVKVDIENDAQALAEFKSLGGEVLPLILIDDGLIRGFNSAALEKHLKQIELL